MEQLSIFDVAHPQKRQRMKGNIAKIGTKEAIDFVMNRHYAGRKPNVSEAWGWYIDGCLVAVVTFGKPASPYLCEGICGKEYSDRVYELNRLVRVEDLEYPLSSFVGGVLRRMRCNNWIIVSFADTGMHHHGYVYQACNFLYTGCTKQRTDRYAVGKHARHAEHDNEDGIRQIRTAKHRYVYFCTFDKRLKNKWREALKYPILPYPKGDNKNYILGTTYTAPLIDSDGNIIKNGENMMAIT